MIAGRLSRVLCLVTAVFAGPMAVSAQGRVISATATARDCDRASAEAIRRLLQDHGRTLIEIRTDEQTRIRKRREETELRIETEMLFGGLIPKRFVETRPAQRGSCFAEIRIPEEELARAQDSWLELLETQRGQTAVLEKLDQLEKQVQDDVQLERQLRDAIQELQKTIRAQRQPSTGIRTGPVRKRLPLWPLAVGAVGAGAMVALQVAEDQRLRTAIAERSLPRSDLEQMVQRRDQWRRAAIASGAGAIAYLILREIVGSAPSSSQDNPAEAGWQFAVKRRGVELTWRLDAR